MIELQWKRLRESKKNFAFIFWPITTEQTKIEGNCQKFELVAPKYKDQICLVMSTKWFFKSVTIISFCFFHIFTATFLKYKHKAFSSIFELAFVVDAADSNCANFQSSLAPIFRFRFRHLIPVAPATSNLRSKSISSLLRPI